MTDKIPDADNVEGMSVPLAAFIRLLPDLAYINYRKNVHLHCVYTDTVESGAYMFAMEASLFVNQHGNKRKEYAVTVSCGDDIISIMTEFYEGSSLHDDAPRAVNRHVVGHIEYHDPHMVDKAVRMIEESLDKLRDKHNAVRYSLHDTIYGD